VDLDAARFAIRTIGFQSMPFDATSPWFAVLRRDCSILWRRQLGDAQRVQRAAGSTKVISTFSRPRTLTFFVPPMVCSQPKHSSMRLVPAKRS
jgi:hypothetical protein